MGLLVFLRSRWVADCTTRREPKCTFTVAASYRSAAGEFVEQAIGVQLCCEENGQEKNKDNMRVLEKKSIYGLHHDRLDAAKRKFAARSIPLPRKRRRFHRSTHAGKRGGHSPMSLN